MRRSTHRLTLTPLYLAAATVGLAGVGAAQAPLLEVEKSDATNLLRVTDDAGFLVRGTPGVGSIPAAGSGVRLMWYPKKAAFRAGAVSGSQWDEVDIGQGSVALGSDTRATGPNSLALNQETEASGGNSIAGGYQSTASGFWSLAIGHRTKATGNASMATGDATVAAGVGSVALGTGVTAQGHGSFAFGDRNIQ